MSLYKRGSRLSEFLDGPKNLVSNNTHIEPKNPVEDFMEQFMRELGRKPRDDNPMEADPNYDPLGDDYG